MSLQSNWVSFMKFSKVLLELLMAWLCFYGVIETQCLWNFDRFSEVWGGK